jgi:hypothetical protein
VFNQKKAKALPPFCEEGIDYLIKLEKDTKEKEKEVL